MDRAITHKYEQLIAQLKEHIAQEFPKGAWLETSRSNYHYFLELASKAPQPVAAKPLYTAPQAKTPPAQARNESAKAPAAAYAPVSPKSSNDSPLPAAKQEPILQSDSKSSQAEPASSSPKTAKEAIKPSPQSKTILLEAPPPSTPPEFKELRAFFQSKLPSVLLSDTIADDRQAKQLACRWKSPTAEICILSFNELPKEQAFLSNLETALSRCLGTAKIYSAPKIESDNGWEKFLSCDNLRLVIASNYNLHTLPGLMKYYREEATGKHTLGKIQLYLLSDLALYMQQPALKASLWKALRQIYP